MKLKWAFVMVFWVNCSLLQSQLNFTINPNQCIGNTVTLNASTGSLSVSSYSWAVIPNSATISSPSNASTNISFFASGNYTVILSVSSGSVISAVQNTVLVQVSPSITLSQSSLTTCIIMNSPKLSKPVTLTATGALSYYWFPYLPSTQTCSYCPQTTVRPQVNTCYTVIGTNSSACSGSAVTCVTVIPQFTFGVTPPSAQICVGQTLSLVAGNFGPGAVGSPSAFTYSWTTLDWFSIDNVLSDTVMVFPLSSTFYTVDVADTRSCISLPQVVSVQVFTCTGYSETSIEESTIHLFPNPASDYCTVESDRNPIISVQVYDVLGRKYLPDFHFEQDLRKLNIDLLSLPSGYYELKLGLNNGSFRSRTLIINH